MRGRILGLAAVYLALAPGVAAGRPKATAQPAPPATANAPAAPAKTPQQPTPPGWRSRCEAAGRTEPLACVVEETAVVTQTGQVLVSYSVRVPGGGADPVALIQIPIGVFLPNGVQVQVDEGTALNLPLQTCEQRGCFAGTTLAPDILAAMRTGKSLKVSFANLSKQTLTVTLPLNGFGPAYDKIK